MLTEEQYAKAKIKQQEIVYLLNKLLLDLSGEHNIEKIYESTYHFQDLNYFTSELQDLSDFWFQEGEYAKK